MSKAQSTFTANVEPPLVLENADSVKWHDEADVIIVGLAAPA